MYLLAFLLIVFAGSVTVYIYYLKEKKEQLESIGRGFCPHCKQDDITLTEEHKGYCSSPRMLTFTCLSCGYVNQFAVMC